MNEPVCAAEQATAENQQGKFSCNSLIKNKQGNLLAIERDREKARWDEHFKETLKRNPPEMSPLTRMKQKSWPNNQAGGHFDQII